MGVSNKWATEAQTHTVAFFHRRVRELVAERLDEADRTWEEARDDRSLELTREDFERIEQELLDTGYRYDMSARISFEETPEKYKPEDVDEVAAPGAGSIEAGTMSEDGKPMVGSGDNVFQTEEDVVGTARLVSSVDTVMEMLANGVPENTVAIIDDSGGTLTAPILEDFTAVVCKGGTVRSHLGILTREYSIPCLMAAEVSGLSDGDQVRVEYRAPATTPYAKEEGKAVRARIFKLS